MIGRSRLAPSPDPSTPSSQRLPAPTSQLLAPSYFLSLSHQLRPPASKILQGSQFLQFPNSQLWSSDFQFPPTNFRFSHQLASFQPPATSSQVLPTPWFPVFPSSQGFGGKVSAFIRTSKMIIHFQGSQDSEAFRLPAIPACSNSQLQLPAPTAPEFPALQLLAGPETSNSGLLALEGLPVPWLLLGKYPLSLAVGKYLNFLFFSA